MRIYKLGEFSKAINAKPGTVISWDKNGTLTAKRTSTGRRYYTDDQITEYLQIPISPPNKKIILYARVSTKNQKDDLTNQIEYLKSYCINNGISFTEIIEDFGSGLNYKRKGFEEILQLIENGEVSKVYFTHKDRFIRFGYEWFESFAEKHGCDLITLTETPKDIHKELVDDLISIVHVFSCKLYGLRNYKRKTKLERVVEQEISKND